MYRHRTAYAIIESGWAYFLGIFDPTFFHFLVQIEVGTVPYLRVRPAVAMAFCV